MIAQATTARSRAEIIAALEGAGVPVGPINTVADAMVEPQVVARGMQIAPEGIPGLRTPIVFSRSQLDVDRAAPVLGQGLTSNPKAM